MTTIKTYFHASLLLAVAVFLNGCKWSIDDTVATPADDVDKVATRVVTDALYHFALASRNSYAGNVVQPLAIQRSIIAASESWKEDHVLPLPAQYIRYAAENFNQLTPDVSINLKSLWPINANNAPTTETEKVGLLSVFNDSSKPYYKTETIDNVRYFTAIYADKAGSMSCIQCHNSHPNSQKDNFKGGDVMGGFVVRLRLDN